MMLERFKATKPSPDQKVPKSRSYMPFFESVDHEDKAQNYEIIEIEVDPECKL